MKKIICFPCLFKNRFRGFSLVELMIAIFIFFLLFSGVMRGLSNIFNVQEDSHELAVASQILGDITEKIMYMRNTAGWDFIDSSTLYFNATTVAEFNSLPGSSLNVAVVPYKDPSGMEIETLKKITITLNWTSNNGKPKSEVFETVLSKPPSGV